VLAGELAWLPRFGAHLLFSGALKVAVYSADSELALSSMRNSKFCAGFLI
jgi:hypothetical protein